MRKPKDKRELFEKCWGCGGTRKLTVAAHVDYTQGKSADLQPGADCPLCTDGYAMIGVTYGQWLCIAKDNARLLVALDNAALAGSDVALKALEGRSAHVAEARRKLAQD